MDPTPFLYASAAMNDLARDFNHARFQPGTGAGFYESYFLRANHATRPLAFWVRYTIFSPKGRPDDAIGELWAVWFDGESGRHVVAKAETAATATATAATPAAFAFAFSRDRLDARIGDATLQPGKLQGGAASRGHQIEWDLEYAGDAEPLFLLPPDLYGKPLPKAKSLVGLPMARFRGALVVDGERIPINDWAGSQNHNWGVKHTDRYAWGQVAGFDNAPESFLEVATAQVKIGPIWTPRLTPLVLRHGGQEFALRSIRQALTRAHGRFGYFHWNFRSSAPGIEIEGMIRAPKEAFVGLRYYNPPGGEKWCLNSKLASCRLVLKRPGRKDETLETQHRAAFEILTDDRGHGLEIRT